MVRAIYISFKNIWSKIISHIDDKKSVQKVKNIDEEIWGKSSEKAVVHQTEMFFLLFLGPIFAKMGFCMYKIEKF